MTGTVYGLICPIAKKVLYIGQTIKPLSIRLVQHKAPKQAWRKSALNVWLSSLREAGLIQSLKIVPIYKNVTLSELDQREMFAISVFSKSRHLLNTKGTDREMKYRKNVTPNTQKREATIKDESGKVTKAPKYPFDQVEAGQCLVLEPCDNKNAILSYAYQYAKKTGKKFTVRKTGEIVTIYRIA